MPIRSRPLTVRAIDADEHATFLGSRPSASFLQTPGWARVKPEWTAESLGFFAGEDLRGVGLVLYRRLPRSRRSLGYLPEGPVLDWGVDAAAALTALAEHLRRRRCFAIRVGPPVVVRRWDAAQVKAGIAEDGIRRLDDLAPTARPTEGAQVTSALRELGWHPQASDDGFAAGQPQYNFWIPLGGRSEEDVLAGMNQQWRRNIKKAAKAGVVVTRGDAADLAAFHELYVHTAERDHFTPRPLSYFTTMFSALDDVTAHSEIRLYLARHDDDLVAATLWVRVGTHVWYSYGASSSDKRDVRGSNAIQWQMIRDAIQAGAEVYDLRGITDTLDPHDDHAGLIQFKVGTGGEAVEYVGEWDLPLNPLLYRGFQLYLRRRG